ncbi:MAG: hypothetical protein P8Z30_13810, partial [Acidobacteriota bacterium]
DIPCHLLLPSKLFLLLWPGRASSKALGHHPFPRKAIAVNEQEMSTPETIDKFLIPGRVLVVRPDCPRVADIRPIVYQFMYLQV